MLHNINRKQVLCMMTNMLYIIISQTVSYIHVCILHINRNQWACCMTSTENHVMYGICIGIWYMHNTSRKLELCILYDDAKWCIIINRSQRQHCENVNGEPCYVRYMYRWKCCITSVENMYCLWCQPWCII